MSVRRASSTVLVIGGLDPTGGAGVAADVRTLESFGVASAVVVTALTVQDGRRVTRVAAVAASLLAEQIACVIDTLPVAAVKCGMFPDARAVGVVARILADGSRPLILDPVLRSSGGQPLASGSVLKAIKTKLLPIAAVVTPNLAEASLIAGMEVKSVEAMEEAARRILTLGARAVVIKGGHLRGAPVDVLASRRRIERFAGRRIAFTDMHGTGCAFASALAAGLARGRSLRASVAAAGEHVRALIARSAPLANGARIRRS
jgi:hydroxymethylpyrimidine/phosphomethylpyrimidine kinase